MRYAYTELGLTAYSSAVRSAYSVFIVRWAVAIIMVHSVPDCAVVVRRLVRSAFSETPGS